MQSWDVQESNLAGVGHIDFTDRLASIASYRPVGGGGRNVEGPPGVRPGGPWCTRRETSYTKAPGGRSLLPMASCETSAMRRTHVDSPPSLARRAAPTGAIAFGNEYAHQRSAETALRVAVCAKLVNMACWLFSVCSVESWLLAL